MVLNQDRLSIFESKRIKEFLEGIKMSINLIILNKVGMMDASEEEIEENFQGIEIEKLPFIKEKVLTDKKLMELSFSWAERVCVA